ncbi:hypothetical protein SH661x_002353 [Planctomicrobium sp. SH661]|uniref:hypothetical protein n=1 Tax=Planctomicrobium sp. SH661 TaxID=3448124 RepID=UPI003F5B4A78
MRGQSSPKFRLAQPMTACTALRVHVAILARAVPLLLMATIPANGCARRPSKPGKAITITFSHQGAPLHEGQVDLSADGGGAYLNEQGEAHFKYVPYGRYSVTVFPPIDPNRESSIETRNPPTVAQKKQTVVIPRKYRDEATSGMEIEVSSDQPARYHFDLKL